MFRILFIQAIVMFIFATIQTFAGNFQSWLNLSFSQRLDYGLEAKIETEQWFSLTTPNYQHVEILPQIIWHYSPRYDFAVGYEYDWTRLEHNMIAVGNSAFFDATVKLSLQRFNLNSRQRFEFGTESSEQGDTEFTALYRPRTVLEYAMPWLPIPLMPFMADEVFFDLNNGTLLENRAQIGLAYRFNKSWRIEVYGMRVDQWDMMGIHSNYPVAGLNLSMQF